MRSLSISFPGNSWSRAQRPRGKTKVQATKTSEIHSKVDYQYFLNNVGLAVTVTTFGIGIATTLILNDQKTLKADVSEGLKALKSDLELIKKEMTIQQSTMQLVQHDLAALAVAKGKPLA